MVLKITVPYALRFEDYHEIDAHAESINAASRELGGKLKIYECAFSPNGRYIGLFYIGRRPSRTAIKQIVLRDCGKIEDTAWLWNDGFTLTKKSAKEKNDE